MKKILLLLSVLTILLTKARAQDTIKTILNKTKVDATKDANTLKSGLANDVITNFYQLAIKNVFGTKKELSYSSTVFGLLSRVRPDYNIDTFYNKTRWARNIELSIKGRIDSSTNISGFGGGVKFYLINKRDITNKNDKIHNQMIVFESEILTDLKKAKLTFDEKDWPKLEPSLQKFHKTLDYRDLDSALKAALTKMGSRIVIGKGLVESAKEYFNDQVNSIKEKPLWSLGSTYYHSVVSKSDTITVQSDFLVGLSRDKGRGFWEFNASTYLQINNNYLQASTAKKFHFETGINRILSEGSDGTSNMELKFFGSFDKGFDISNYPTTTKANLTYRYLVSQFGGFWIPITLSYDPDKGKLFGFVDLTFNIDPKK